MSTPLVETDFLIVGAGPAGATLACCLGQNGLKGILISNSKGTADTPRAHAVNPSAMEIMRDLGIEDDCLRLGITGKPLESFRWCKSIAGDEYGKVLAWGGNPRNMVDIDAATPCRYLDLPQSYMEPILVKYANHQNFEILFQNELTQARQVSGGILCDVKNLISGSTYQIKTKLLFGADGGRSVVARSFPFKFLREPSGGVGCNMLIQADADHIMKEREAELHFITNPGRKWQLGKGSCLRMVRPYNQWLLTVVTPNTTVNPFQDFTPESPEIIGYVKEVFGDDSIDVKVLRLDPWVIRETVAEEFSVEDNIFILGDAAHRHPPVYGLGSNTCIADAYNLGWKVAYVHKGWAGRALLRSYSVERQPVGALVVKKANEGDRDSFIWRELGVFAPTPEEGVKQLNQIYEATPAGAERRERLHTAFEESARVGESIGIGLNQWYTSDAIYLGDETGERPKPDGDFITKPLISTYQGTRLPHAWLDIATRQKEISTHDLAGHGSFCILTGCGGDDWLRAAKNISEATGIPINGYSIGFGCDYHDVYRDWYRRREVNEDGCVLVRPDRFVAWRAVKFVPDCEAKLLQVLNQILSRQDL